MLVLEEAGRAARRGAACLAEVAGAAAAYAPDLDDAARRAVACALAAAGAEARDVDAVVTSMGAAESAALASLFCGRVPICSVQGAVGDCAGATSAVQVAAGLAELEAGPRRTVLTLTVDAAGHASAILLRRGDRPS
jgi:3-oxoacyl-(acyl-carrier-protein) synthase